MYVANRKMKAAAAANIISHSHNCKRRIYALFLSCVTHLSFSPRTKAEQKAIEVSQPGRGSSLSISVTSPRCSPCSLASMLVAHAPAVDGDAVFAGGLVI